MKHTESGDGGKEMAYDDSPSPGNIHRRLPFFVMDEPQTPEELEEVKEDLQRLVEEVTDTPTSDDPAPMDTDETAIEQLQEEIEKLEFKQQTEILSHEDERQLTEEIEEKKKRLAELKQTLPQTDCEDPTIDDISGGHIPRENQEDEHNADDADTLDTSPERWGPVDANLSVTAHDTDRDESAYLCCSECGERIELVAHGTPFKVFRGGVCGCADPPGEWRAEELHTTSDRS